MNINCFTGARFACFYFFGTCIQSQCEFEKNNKFHELDKHLFLFPSLALPVIGSYSEHVCFIVCVRGSIVLNKACSVPVGT